MRAQIPIPFDELSGQKRAAARFRLTPLQWVICAVACVGFAFDTYEILSLPLVVRPALADVGGIHPGTPGFNRWVGLLFFLPFAAGGVFGLLGGYLTDRFGRRRVLVWSVLIYGFSAMASGYATSPAMLLGFRCATIVGVCVEYVAGIAWLAELFPEPKRREAALGYAQAFSAAGGFLVAGAYYVAVTYDDRLPAIRGGHEAWRYTLLFGLLPAVPLLLIRPFLPESPVWAEKKAAGTLARPRVSELFRPGLRKTTLVTTLMVACSFAVSFGATHHVPRIVPGLPQAQRLPKLQQEQIISAVHFCGEVGNVAGRVAFAVLAVRVVSRRRLLRFFLLPGLVLFPLVFLFAATRDLRLLEIGMILAPMVMVAQFSFWGNYLPRVYPTHLRGTGEGFATNIGGRMFGTAAALLTTQLAGVAPGATPSVQLTYAAAVVAVLAYCVNLVASFWLPEPDLESLPE